MKIDFYETYKTPMSKKEIAQKKIIYRKFLRDKKNYLSFKITSEIVQNIVMASFKDDVLFGKKIVITFCYFSNRNLKKKIINEELEKIKLHFKGKCEKIFIELPEKSKKIKKIFQSLKMKPFGNLLVGKVLDGLKYLMIDHDKIISKTYIIKLMRYNKDIKSVMALEVLSHHYDNSSLVIFDNIKKINRMKRIYRQMCKDKSAWIITHKDKIIGTIGIIYNNEREGDVHIGTISIDPKFQGKGLSKLLYHQALADMSIRKVKLYIGYTSTTKVLILAKKLKRRKVKSLLTS